MNDSVPSTRTDQSDAVRIIVLGSTGSIGTNTLEVIEHLQSSPSSEYRFQVVGLAAGSNYELAFEQARRFNVPNVALSQIDLVAADEAQQPFRLLSGRDAARILVEEVDCDLIVAAVVGVAGLSAVMSGIRKGCRIALANKETLVAAGDLVIAATARHGAEILPVDSEHSAVFQCIQSRTDHDARGCKAVRQIILTASGGPFRNWSAERIAEATVADALNHPTWEMGPKVTVDSASLMNKALEMIEAHHLFGMGNDRIDVLVHPQSIVHGMVEFEDGSVLAQIGAPDMRTPIQYALTYPERPIGCSNRVDWTQLSRLDFEPPDLDRFPALRLARQVIQAGGSSGTVFNAANEVAVKAFLDSAIPFGTITRLIHGIMDEFPVTPINSLDEMLEIDKEVRRTALERIELALH